MKEKRVRYFDYSLLFIVIFLVCFGLVVLYSTSSYNGQLKFQDAGYYLKKQAFAAGLGLVAMMVVANIDYHFWKHFWLLAYVVAFGLCTLVLFVAEEIKGSRRWLHIGPLSLQPSEIAKIAIIIFLATIICRMPKKMGSLSTMIKVVIMILPMVGIVAVENLSTAIIILGIAIALVFVSSPKYMQFVVIGGIVVSVGVVFILAASYRVDRLKIWLEPEKYEKGYQTLQGLYAIGSGGLWGRGLGNSIQKLGKIPEPYNDYIFAIICEELGIFGAGLIILLFIYLLYRIYTVSQLAEDLLGRMISIGVLSHIALQVILNLMVVTNLFPTTGVTLPFFSYGGTATVFLMIEIGLVLSVNKYSVKRRMEYERERERERRMRY